MVWTLSTRGRTERAYANLKPEYVLDQALIMKNIGGGSERPGETVNQAPLVRIDRPTSRPVRVGERCG